MKRQWIILIVTAVLAILIVSAAAEALPLHDFVEQTLVPMARANDYEWRVVREFSNEELGALIEGCAARGIDLPADGYLMREYRKGKAYSEQSALLAVCEAAHGGDFGTWRIAERQWLRDATADLGFDWEQEAIPGPEDLPEDEARAVLLAALHEAFGDDMPFEDPARFRLSLSFRPDQEWDSNGKQIEDGWSWELSCIRVEDGRWYAAYADHAGENAVAREVDSERFAAVSTPLEAYALTREEAIHLAAEAIRAGTGDDVPLEDPEVFYANANPLTRASDGLLYWKAVFSSNSRYWGCCSAAVEDASREVHVLSADVEELTADNILQRYQQEFGALAGWPLSAWASLSEESVGMPAATLKGKILAATRYILPQEGLISQMQADEIAFRAAELTGANLYCLVLIDAEPHPVWKFCLQWNEARSYTVVEVDAATGEVLLLEPWRYDEEPGYCVYSLHRTWARLTLMEEGPLPLASMALHHTYDTASIPLRIDDERFFRPVIRGLHADFESLQDSHDSFHVSLDADGIPETISLSTQKGEILCTEFALGKFSTGEFAQPLSADTDWGILPFNTWENIVATGENIRQRRWKHPDDWELTSITHYSKEHIWVFEYNDPHADEADVIYAGGGWDVAVDSLSRTVICEWIEE